MSFNKCNQIVKFAVDLEIKNHKTTTIMSRLQKSQRYT